VARSKEERLMARDKILHKVRTALGRSAGQDPAPAPPARIRLPDVSLEARVESFVSALQALNGKTLVANGPGDAKEYAASLAAGKKVVASNAHFLRDWCITSLPGVQTGFTSTAALRDACAVADLGITGADYALADTGTLVMLSSREEARLVSLLPPVHLAIVPRDRLLSGLDELFTLLPQPARQTSSMVMITGPSRTADIEQILVRGVHGPGEIHVVIV
jgi:L-lactate dehydrogenase complex protein LldG